MLSLAFSVPDRSSGWWTTWSDLLEAEAAGVGETGLRYKYCSVRLELIVGDVPVVVGNVQVPLVDFALQMRWVSGRLSQGEVATVDFTENANWIRFRPVGDEVFVMASRSEAEGAVPRAVMIEACDRFVSTAYATLVAQIPGIEDNPVVRLLATAHNEE
ncbi:hypothetical protein [Actinokineospora diospyrosa]|uniref:hypothetical protein n=1 Tax=Actinokineospora diospyrosa TaxID=103728 RepID=UPI0020A463D4|nr:hypothetical protein [Actinokineospora diospyrosa]